MNITPISTFKIQTNTPNIQNKNVFIPPLLLKKDIFQKTTQTQTFAGKTDSQNSVNNDKISDLTNQSKTTSAPQDSYQDFLIYVKDSDFLNKIQEITSYKNYIGSGFEGTVYEIPQEPRWVLKENKRMGCNINKIDKQITPIEDKMPLINVGQAIARIEIGHGDALSIYQILKTQHGTEYGIAPSPISSNSYLESPSTKKLYKYFLSQMASLPVSSYEHLIDNLSYINDCGYKPDYFNPNNFLLEGTDINMVDTEPIDKANYQNDFGNTLYSLLIGEFFNNSFSEETPPQEIEELNTQITTKFITAMKNRGKKFSTDNVHFQTFLKTNLSSPYFNTDNFNQKIEYLKQNNLI